MSFEEFKDEFILACDFIDVPILDEATQLQEIPDFDSLAMLGVIVMLETKFSLTATGQDILAQETLGGLHKFAVKK